MAEQLNLFSILGFDGDSQVELEQPIESHIDKRTTLKEIAQQCATCERCALYESRTHSVFSDGNPDAKIMLIGEGPSQNEDDAGIPFVGEAGQLLDNILLSVNFQRQRDLYICHIIKCRPPDDRAPTQQEMEQCLPYLEHQLEQVKPQIIILTGATAIKRLLKAKSSVSRIRGKWQSWRGIDVMPIFHPAHLLKNESKQVGSPKWLTWQDMKAVRQKYDEILLEEDHLIN